MYHIYSHAFVDDADHIQSLRFEYDIIEGVEIEMQKAINLWEGF